MNSIPEQATTIRERMHGLVDAALGDLEDAEIRPGAPASREEIDTMKGLAIMVAGSLNLDEAAKVADMGEKFKPEIYTAKEFRALLKTFSTKYPTGVRNAAMVAAAYAGGLRCAEVLGLRVKDVRNVDDDEGECFIQNGKGSKSRTVCLSASAMKRINAWKKTRREILKERGVKSAPLFCTLDGKPVQSQYVRAMMTRAGAKAKLTKRCHFHGLRHSFAMETVRGKTPLNVVRKALGHSSLAVTTAYLDHINGDDLREAANAVPEF